MAHRSACAQAIIPLLLFAGLIAGCGQRIVPTGGTGGAAATRQAAGATITGTAPMAEQSTVGQSGDSAYIQQLSERGSLVLLRAKELGRWVDRYPVKPEVADDEIDTAAISLDDALVQGRKLPPPREEMAAHQEYLATLDQLTDGSRAAVDMLRTSTSEDEDAQRAKVVESQLNAAIGRLDRLMRQVGAPIIRDESLLVRQPAATAGPTGNQPPAVTPLTSAEQLVGVWHGGAVIVFGLGDIKPEDWGELTFRDDGAFQTNAFSGAYALEPDGRLRLTTSDRTFVVNVTFPDSSSILVNVPPGTPLMKITSSEGGGIEYIRVGDVK